MGNKRIRLTESDLHNLIMEEVNAILNAEKFLQEIGTISLQDVKHLENIPSEEDEDDEDAFFIYLWYIALDDGNTYYSSKIYYNNINRAKRDVKSIVNRIIKLYNVNPENMEAGIVDVYKTFDEEVVVDTIEYLYMEDGINNMFWVD